MEELIQRVGIPMFIQISIECWNELILIILISTMIVGKTLDKTSGFFNNVKIPLTAELIVFYLAALLYNAFDITAHSLLGTHESYSYIVVYISIFLYFTVGEFQTLLFLQVIKKHILEKNGNIRLKNTVFVIQLLQIVNLLLLVLNPFLNTLYIIDENNEYLRSPTCYLWQWITIATFAFAAVIIVIQWKKTDPFIKRIILIAALLPTCGLVGSFFTSNISLNNITVTISAILMYMVYERNKTKLVVKNTYELENTRVQLMENQLVIEQNKQELQEKKIRLLVAQIQPHFIFNSLMALQSKCTDNPELYRGINSFGRYLRASFEAMTENTLIPFEDELKSIKAYIQLERLNYGEKLQVEYDIEIDRFLLPALCIEPLVENAIRYGVDTFEKGGLVKISVRDEPDCILIEVWDDGSGGNKLTDAQEGRKSIGIENVRLRLEAMSMGDLTITQDDTGTSAVVRLKYEEDLCKNAHH